MRLSRHLGLPALAALLAAGLLGAMGLLSPAFTDYEVEAEPAARALGRLDLLGFLEHAPAYGGSLLLRAPFAVVGEATGGALSVYRWLAVPALLAGAWLAVVAFAALRDRPRAAWAALGIIAANPFTLRALETGHAEELLTGVACVAAVLAASRDRRVAAGVLLGLAGACKPWAVLAALPVLWALGSGRDRALTAAIAGGVCASALAPFVAFGAPGVAGAAAVATGSGGIFQPWSAWWFLGEHAGPVMGLRFEKVGYRTGPEWVLALSHPLVVVAGLLLPLLLWPRRRRSDALLLLAVVLGLRCALDTWNTAYYLLPAVLALATHEAVVCRRGPLATASVVLAAWIACEVLVVPDEQAALALAVIVVGLGAGAARLAGVRLPAHPPTAPIASTASS